MTYEFWLLFIAASIPIHLAPGPNNILALAHGARHGYITGHLSALGRFPPYLAFFGISAIGLGTVLATSAYFFVALKWIGGAYLVWIGIQLIRSSKSVAVPEAEAASSIKRLSLAKREFTIAITNPKAILFASAFYAQFIDPASPHYIQQFAQMVTVSIFLELIGAGIYAATGDRIGLIAKQFNILGWLERVSGAALICLGLLLAFSRRPQTS